MEVLSRVSVDERTRLFELWLAKLVAGNVMQCEGWDVDSKCSDWTARNAHSCDGCNAFMGILEFYKVQMLGEGQIKKL